MFARLKTAHPFSVDPNHPARRLDVSDPPLEHVAQPRLAPQVVTSIVRWSRCGAWAISRWTSSRPRKAGNFPGYRGDELVHVVPSRVVESGSYTPDFAAIALDALGFRPVPRFPFGRSPLSEPDTRPPLVAPRFQVVDGGMIPAAPDLHEQCSAIQLAQTTIDTRAVLFPCEREKIILSASPGSAGIRRQ